MKVLTRYLTKEFLKLFLLCESVFVFLFLMVDFLQKIDNFVQAQATKGAMVLYFFYKVPFIIFNMIPAAALIAAVIFFSSMRKRNEVTAVKACGLNIVAVCRTIIAVAFFITVFSFLYSETVVPFASSKGQGI